MNKNDIKKHQPRNKGLVDPKKIKEYNVHHECELLDFLFQIMPNVAKNNVKSILKNHQVAVGGVPVSQFNYKLYPEDVVIVSKNRINKKAVDHKLPILYEDNDIVVMDKPSGLLSIASDKEKGKTAYRMVSDYVASKDPKARIFVVHRLDEDTSGVLLFAKNFKMKEALQKKWQDIVTKRGYYAIVEGKMEKPEDTFKDYLSESSVHLMYVSGDKKHGKLCTTSYQVMGSNKLYSLLDVNIESGRKNQIRVQLGHRGHYVIGDDKYGEPSNPLNRLGLHAYELDLIHPFTGKKMKFNSPLPASFKALIFGEGKVPEKEEKKRVKHLAKESKTVTKIKKSQAKQKSLNVLYGSKQKKRK